MLSNSLTWPRASCAVCPLLVQYKQFQNNTFLFVFHCILWLLVIPPLEVQLWLLLFYFFSCNFLARFLPLIYVTLHASHYPGREL